MEQDIGKLKRERAGHRGVVTRCLAECDALLAESVSDTDSLSTHLEFLTKKLALLETYDSKILSGIDDEDEIITEISDADTFHLKAIFGILSR